MRCLRHHPARDDTLSAWHCLRLDDDNDGTARTSTPYLRKLCATRHDFRPVGRIAAAKQHLSIGQPAHDRHVDEEFLQGLAQPAKPVAGVQAVSVQRG